MSPCCHGNLCFGGVIENIIKYVKFPQILHTLYKYVLNSVVKISMMFAKYFEYYTIILMGGQSFVDTLYILDIVLTVRNL